MKLSIATVSLPGALDAKIEAAAAAGFDGIELFERDLIADPRSPRAIGESVRSAGLDVMLYQPFRDFEGLPEALRVRALDRAERKFDLMQELGCTMMLVCSTVHPEASGDREVSAADLFELGRRAAARGLLVGYEALSWGKHVSDHRDAWDLVQCTGHDNVGLVLDSFHTLARRIDTATIADIPGNRIFFVQLADAPEVEMDFASWSRHYRNMPGEGDLDIPGFVQEVLSTGYDGPLSIEVFNDQFRRGSTEQIAIDGRRSLVNLLDNARRAGAKFETGLAVAPAAAAPLGVPFLEASIGGEEAKALLSFIETLGFTLVGQQRNTANTLFQQGNIRLLVAAENADLQEDRSGLGGPVFRGLGVRVHRTADVVERAMILGAMPSKEKVSTEGRGIGSLHGPGHTVVHVIDDEFSWSSVYESVAIAENTVGLTSIDHIGKTMRDDEVPSAALYFMTIFGFEKQSSLDIEEPGGLVRSQALIAHEGDVRIVLNGRHANRALDDKHAPKMVGGAIQHVAFATDDIFASAECLKERGFAPLPIPGNYYDDLSTRFDLSSSKLKALRAANILYDRQGSAEFYQLYSKTVIGGVIFEIVQRNPRYEGFGAINAPVRIAALWRIALEKTHAKP